MERGRVVRGAGDTGFLERRGDLGPARGPYGVHVVDVPGLVDWQLDHLAESELGVARGRATACLVPPAEAWEEDAEHRGLDGIQARVRAHELERLLVVRAVEAEHADALGDVIVETGHEAAVSEREEVLGREEAERRAHARLRDALGAESLPG